MATDDSESRTQRVTELFENGIPDEESSVASLTGEFYRGEVDRMATWRGRLDQTTNWAVVVVGAILTWAFSSADNPHYVILIGVFGVTAFLAMEATRYREYDIWRNRVRVLQRGLYAQMYAPDPSDDAGWQAKLGNELRDPEFEMSYREALTHRLRRSYVALLLLLLAAWIARITVFEASETWEQTSSILTIPGQVVTGIVVGFYVLVLAVAAWSARGGRVREFQE
jgi:uncharacterized membrane protein